MTEHNKYDFDSFIFPIWPVPSENADGSWIRIWDIVLDETPSDSTKVAAIEKRLSNEEITVIIRLNEDCVTIEVHTLRWSLDDDLIIYSYKILQEVNDKIGKIRTIQGQERDTWHSGVWYKDRYKFE